MIVLRPVALHARITAASVDIVESSPEEAARRTQADHLRWSALIQRLGIKLQHDQPQGSARMPRHELTSLSPFKGGVGGGIGSHRYYQHAKIPHPHPGPPLEGEGDFAWLNNVANQELQ